MVKLRFVFEQLNLILIANAIASFLTDIVYKEKNVQKLILSWELMVIIVFFFIFTVGIFKVTFQ